MGMMGEMEKKMEEEERKLIHDIVKELPLVPDRVAYWWVVHAGPLNCGPDREHVEKELILHHKKL